MCEDHFSAQNDSTSFMAQNMDVTLVHGACYPHFPTLTHTLLTQNDSTSSMAKNLDVALVHDEHVVILDDTEQVWPNHSKHLIKV